MKARNNNEELLQRAVVNHLRIYAQPAVIWYHCPSGEYRSKATAGRLKGMGVIRGVPDLCFVLPGGIAAYLEIKIQGGVVSKEQQEFARKCEVLGALHHVAYSLDAALDWLIAIGVLKVAKS